jgi:hypothetical protein
MAQYDKYGELIPESTQRKLKTDRKAWKYILLNILTLGFYEIFFFMPMTFEVDKIAPKPDRSKTMNFVFAFILALFTFNIVLTVWLYMFTERVEEALAQRGIEYDFSTNDFWNFYFFGGLFVFGNFIAFFYFHKLCRAMNLLCADYNEKGTVK